MGCLIVAQAETIRVAKHRRALRTARPILAGHVLVGRKSGAIRLRAGKNVVAIGLVADAIIYLTLLGERGLLGEIIGAVQLRDVLGDNHAFGVHPRTFADAIARVHGTGALRGQVSMPGLASRADRRGKFLAMPVGAGQSAKIGALAMPTLVTKKVIFACCAPAGSADKMVRPANKDMPDRIAVI